MSAFKQSLTPGENGYRNFVDSLEKSPATRVLYIQAIHYYVDFLRIPRDSYEKLLEKTLFFFPFFIILHQEHEPEL
jgi:hypothetical protein